MVKDYQPLLHSNQQPGDTDSERTSGIDSEQFLLPVLDHAQFVSAPSHVSVEKPDVDVSSFPLVAVAARTYYCLATDECVTVRFSRRGNLNLTTEVSYRTEDQSAVAGEHYVATAGRLIFEPGVKSKEFSIQLVDDEFFNATTEFKVVLSSEDLVGGVLSERAEALVKRLDTSTFPSDKLNGVSTEDADPWHVLREVFKLFWTNDDIHRGTKWFIFIDVVNNLYYFMTLLMNVILLNHIIKKDEDEPAQWLTQHRKKCLLIYAGINLVCLAILHALDYSKTSCKVEGTARIFLQTSVLTKYLNYPSTVRQNVPDGDVAMAVQRDAQSVVSQGYLALIFIAEDVGKLLCMMIFAVTSPHIFGYEFDFYGFLPLVLFPVCLFPVFALRQKIVTTAIADSYERENSVAQQTDLITDNFDLILDYDKRSFARQAFYVEARLFQAAKKYMIQVLVNTEYLSRWVTRIIIAGYIVFGGMNVVDGKLTVGMFVTNLKIFDSCEVIFLNLFNRTCDLQYTLPAVMNLFNLLNLDTECHGQMHLIRQATERQMQEEEELKHDQSELAFMLDTLPIDLDLGMTVSFADPSGHKTLLNFTGRIEVPQGSMTAFTGPRGAGKHTLLNIIAGRQLPIGSQTSLRFSHAGSDNTLGRFFMPPHLQIASVGRQPIFYKGTLLENLTFGDTSDEVRHRVIAICNKLKLPSELFKNLDYDADWTQYFSDSTCQLLNIARALIFNPEVICLHKPLEKVDHEHQPHIMEVLREHIDHKGLELPEDTHNRRMPRTVFLTSNNPIAVMSANLIYKIASDTGVTRLSHDEVERILRREQMSRSKTLRHLDERRIVEKL